MKLVSTILLTVCFSVIAQAQEKVDFESFDLPVDSFLNGSNGNGGFSTASVFIPNTFTDFGMGCCWTGWAISSMTDTLTPGPGNQYSSMAGAGNEGSNTYAVTYSPDEGKIILTGGAAGHPVAGMYVTNNAYAYYSMLEGDAYAKKFGGVDGTDPDYFLLTIKAYYNGQLSTDSVDFYLADYRFADDSQDYLVKDWTYVDLRSLGSVDSLSLRLSSTDIGVFGMNTPAYFCLDDLELMGPSTSISEHNRPVPLKLYPNPASSYVFLDWPFQRGQLELLQVSGVVVRQQVVTTGINRIPLDDLATGIYWVRISSEEEVHLGKLILE